VTLTAEPITHLEPLQPIHFTLAVTNRGPKEIPFLFLYTSPLYDDIFTIYDGTSDCGLGTQVADGPTTYWYYRVWDVSSEVLGYPPLEPGETRTCHFTESLWSSAPPQSSYSFRIPESWSDPDPSNDVSTVYLRRAVATASVPALSPTSMWLLVGFLFSTALVQLGPKRT
jgi:hypothetical protein